MSFVTYLLSQTSASSRAHAHLSCCSRGFLVATEFLGQNRRVARSRIVLGCNRGQSSAEPLQRIVPAWITGERVETEWHRRRHPGRNPFGQSAAAVGGGRCSRLHGILLCQAAWSIKVDSSERTSRRAVAPRSQPCPRPAKVHPALQARRRQEHAERPGGLPDQAGS